MHLGLFGRGGRDERAEHGRTGTGQISVSLKNDFLAKLHFCRSTEFIRLCRNIAVRDFGAVGSMESADGNVVLQLPKMVGGK